MASASKRVLITGLDSFTGRHLGRYLSGAGYQVFGTSRQSGNADNLWQCDIADADQCVQMIQAARPDYVIHLAGISFVGHMPPEDFYKVNVLGTENLLQAIARHAPAVRKVILASSATVYGNQGLEVLDESLMPRPANHYGISKLAMECVAAHFYNRMPIVITRPFNYTGPGQPEHFLVPKIVAHFKQRKPVIELGNLNVAREFNDVDFACDIYTKLLKTEAAGVVVNLCSGKGIKLLDIISMMNEIAGYEIEIKVNPDFVRGNEIPKLVGSPEKLYSIIGAPSKNNIFDTLQRMYAS